MMDLVIEDNWQNGFKKLNTSGDACLFFRHRVHPMNDFYISTHMDVVEDGHSGWLREAAELFLRLADQLEEERTKDR